MKDNQVISIKLLAVSDTKTKLIGLYQFKYNTKEFTNIERGTHSFDKCIDKEARITFSAKFTGHLLSR